MDIQPFATEQFFSRYEFSAPHLLGVSDCESISIDELLALAKVPLSSLGSLRLGYTESTGHPDLRQAIASTYETVSEKDVVVLTSPVEGIYLTMRTLLNPGDEAIVLRPCYDALRNTVQHVCGNAIGWDLLATEKGWELDLDALEKRLSPKTRLVVMNFPHNPTGFLPDTSQLNDLLHILEKNGTFVLSDEMYRGTEFAERPMLPSVADRLEKSIVLSGLSKTYGLPGLRSGWLVIKNEQVRDELVNWKHYTSICPPAPSEFLATVALSVRDWLRDQNRSLIRQNVALADEFFARRDDFFTWRRPLAGSVALVGINVPSATEYCHRLAKEAGVVLLPGPCLGHDDKHVRFGFGRKSFAKALQHYDETLSTPAGP